MIDQAVRRRRLRRGVAGIALVGGSGLLAIGITFAPWTHSSCGRSLSGWTMYRRYGVMFDAYDDDVGLDFDEHGWTNGLTGVTTLLGGVLLVVASTLQACTFDPESRVGYGFGPYPDWAAITVRMLGGLAIALLVLTGFPNVAVGPAWTGLACFVLAGVAAGGIFDVTLRRGI